MLLLATRDASFLQAAGLLRLWESGFVEPIVPPESPRHIAAQQLLALALQQGSFGRNSWRSWWGDLPVMQSADEILTYLVDEGFFDADGDLLFIGRQAEQHFGRRHFMELTSVFTADPELAVVHGRTQIGSVDPTTLTVRIPEGAPRIVALAGRAWVVTHVDWRRRTVSVVPHEGRGRSRWVGQPSGLSGHLAQAMRAVLLGDDHETPLSRRATTALGRLRIDLGATVHTEGTVLQREASASRWWTYGGTRANASLAASLAADGLEVTADATGVAIGTPAGAADVRGALLRHPDAAPEITREVLDGLKFSTALPLDVAAQVMVARSVDPAGAHRVARAPIHDNNA